MPAARWSNASQVNRRFPVFGPAPGVVAGRPPPRGQRSSSRRVGSPNNLIRGAIARQGRAPCLRRNEAFETA